MPDLSNTPSLGANRERAALIVGIDSRIGRALAADLQQRGITVHGTSRKTQNLSESVSLLDLGAAPPDIPYERFAHVVICAGMTNIDACEDNQTLCQEVNISATIALIDRCLARGCFVVFPSSNAVFDGTRPFNRHDDAPDPKSMYGRAKLAVENHMTGASQSKTAVVRFTKVMPPDGGIVEKWRSDAAQGKPITVYEDKLFSPISMENTVRALHLVMSREQPGIFQAGGEREITYSDFARQVFAHEPDILKLLRPVPEPPGKPYFNRHNSLITHLPD